MRVAVILTGALRTIKRTMKYLKQNVLLGPEYDLFACVQHDGTTGSEHDWTMWWRDEVGPWLRSLTWFSLDHVADWVVHRERLLSHMSIPEGWKQYLRCSGSMIEYVQLQLAYFEMTDHEHRGDFKYEYVMRARTDAIYAKPVDFHWLRWSEDDVAARIAAVSDALRLCGKPHDHQEVMTYFMATLLSDDSLPNIEHIHASYQPSCTDDPAQAPVSPAALREYLAAGRYILTLRKNNLYILRRDLFNMIPCIAGMYGQFRCAASDDYWFNAEGQFRAACYHSGVAVFDYSTSFEESSLEPPGAWNEASFFDADFNPRHPHMLFCVVRK